jgi:hypothetical protein
MIKNDFVYIVFTRNTDFNDGFCVEEVFSAMNLAEVYKKNVLKRNPGWLVRIESWQIKNGINN